MDSWVYMLQKKSDSKENKARHTMKAASSTATKSGNAMEALTSGNVDCLKFAVVAQAGIINTQRKIIYFLSVIIILSLLAADFSMTRPLPEAKYFGQKTDGTFAEITPLSERLSSLVDMRMWTDECIIDLLDISFVKVIQKTSTKLNKCFTPKGRAAFIKWFVTGSSENKVAVGDVEFSVDSEIGNIITKRLKLDASLKGPSEISEIKPYINPETGQKTKRWRVAMPVIVKTSEGMKGTGVNVFNIVLILIRVNDVSKKQGVAIDGFSITQVDYRD